MLDDYFGFGENPFGVTPDPSFLYSSRTHREALASLYYAFCCNRGFTTLVAPPGMGKTTLLFQFLQRIRNQARTAFLFNSQCDPTDLLRNILIEIGLIPQDGLGRMLQQLNGELVETARSGRHFVVIVDEAQNLSKPALETLRMLSNFETTRAKLMQIVLSGQPQLGETLLHPSLVQLRQRISTFCRLEPFAPDETTAYIGHRINVVGYQGPPLFTSDALAQIAKASEGIPRNINTLCFNALSLCYALKQKRADCAILAEVLEDLQPPPQERAAQEKPNLPLPVATKEPEVHTHDNRLSRLRIPALAAGILILISGAFWVADVFSAGHRPPPPQVQSSQPMPHAGVSVPAEIFEFTVSPRQTLSEISILELGTYDDEVLRQIQQLNPRLKNPDRIVPGEKLLLPSRERLQRQK